MIFSIFLSFYLFILVLFSTFINPVMCSVLLVFNSLILSILSYLYMGISWYSLLFSLVYVGGVYIILLFVSAHIQNDQVTSLGWYHYLLLFSLLFSNIFIFNLNIDNINECGLLLCGSLEYLVYVFFCLSLIIAFLCISYISSLNNSFLR